MQFKKIISAALSFVMTAGIIAASGLTFSASAASGTYGQMTYDKYSDHVEITGGSTSMTGSVDIPSAIEGLPVTSISAEAFKSCIGITSVRIPASVTDIGNRAFNGCSGIKNLTISNGVINIGTAVFQDCSSLTSIVIPASVIRLKTDIFKGCTSLASLTVDNPDCKMPIYSAAIPASTTIYGYYNSTAQTYADTYSRKFVGKCHYGDVNQDKVIDAIDASSVLSEYAASAVGKGSVLSGSGKSLADVNKDGIIDAVDASKILGYYAYTATGGKNSAEKQFGII